MPGSSPYQSALNTALKLLSRREHTRRELHRKLDKRGIRSDVIRPVLDECERLDYLNDVRSAEMHARELHRRGYGTRRIRLELKKKGISAPSADAALSEAGAAAGEHEAACRILAKRRRHFDREPDPKKRRSKMYRFLYNRGFSPAVIADVLGQTDSGRSGTGG